VRNIHWSSVKGKPLSVALIFTKFVKPFSDIKLEFDINFSSNAQNLGLIFCWNRDPRQENFLTETNGYILFVMVKSCYLPSFRQRNMLYRHFYFFHWSLSQNRFCSKSSWGFRIS